MYTTFRSSQLVPVWHKASYCTQALIVYGINAKPSLAYIYTDDKIDLTSYKLAAKRCTQLI
jgi:hypothetical protein